MNRLLTLFALLIVFSSGALAVHVDENKAKQIGLNFLTANGNASGLKSTSSLNLAYKSSSTESSSLKSAGEVTYFYVFNSGTDGFVIISGDDNVTPVLGYSNEGAFDPNNIPTNARKWFEEYKNQIRYVIDNEIPASTEIEEEWDNYLNSSSQGGIKAASAMNNPLIETTWSQSPYYNDLCPFDVNDNKRSVTGCVATAMAQIMKYWNYPATGSGFHSYKHSEYGTLSANFGSTTYDWSLMTNTVSSTNDAVAKLMYHCGVSVDMNYSPQSSGAYVISSQSPVTNCSEYALETYFGYKKSLRGVEKSNYTQDQWLSLLKNEFDANRPVLYAGFGSGGGHCFVADGYDNNNFIHFNWGWNGAYDGYFAITALNPGGVGTGGGSGKFNNDQQAVIGIEPPASSLTYKMRLNDYVTPSATSIGYGNAFSVTTNIANEGTNTFTGEYCAAIFDTQNNFIDYVQILTEYTLQGRSTYGEKLSFSNDGLFSLLPGTYYIGIFYRPTDGNWVQLSNYGNYLNMVQLDVVNPNEIKLNSAIKVTPEILIQGKPASVNLNIVNNENTTFKGKYDVSLYNLDGTLAQTLSVIEETNGLLSGNTYASPYLTFSSSSVDVNPGTYLLAVQHNPNNAGWKLTGSSTFQNPIKVIVKAPVVEPDKYEANNDINSAYALPVTFTNNEAKKNSAGSNLHTAGDNDYYKVTLQTGYSYAITARLQDMYKSNDGNKYTADVLFSYSKDGINWSDTYDDEMSGNISVTNGGTVYFRVAPYFEGGTGTYLLDLSISKSQSSLGFEMNDASQEIKIYPNPAADYITIDLNQFTDQVSMISILNMQGQKVMSVDVPDGEKNMRVPLNGVANGVYFVQVIGSRDARRDARSCVSTLRVFK